VWWRTYFVERGVAEILGGSCGGRRGAATSKEKRAWVPTG
jgi:hypothetical protein